MFFQFGKTKLVCEVCGFGPQPHSTTFTTNNKQTVNPSKLLVGNNVSNLTIPQLVVYCQYTNTHHLFVFSVMSCLVKQSLQCTTISDQVLWTEQIRQPGYLWYREPKRRMLADQSGSLRPAHLDMFSRHALTLGNLQKR